ncbi:hypothetical protein GP486_000509 [Trichoglossum hirsutum]|uniref:Uncharacterized protein n=1 Tax=Trichoglossum hirsutum TaxID=265104 RepID=A0A9P8LIW6_9PEZI|nr:hypothetical protein GP486_000509 [Trichoglossum hirsutum]
MRVICVGLFPYERDILPPIATALAYCPRRRGGTTPSIQVLAQSMTMSAIDMKTPTYARRTKTSRVPDDAGEAHLLEKFTMKLRDSRICCSASVVFANAVLVPVRSAARRIRASSHFAEWLGGMTMLHRRFGFKPSVDSGHRRPGGRHGAPLLRFLPEVERGGELRLVPGPAMVSYMDGLVDGGGHFIKG